MAYSIGFCAMAFLALVVWPDFLALGVCLAFRASVVCLFRLCHLSFPHLCWPVCWCFLFLTGAGLHLAAVRLTAIFLGGASV